MTELLGLTGLVLSLLVLNGMNRWNQRLALPEQITASAKALEGLQRLSKIGIIAAAGLTIPSYVLGWAGILPALTVKMTAIGLLALPLVAGITVTALVGQWVQRFGIKQPVQAIRTAIHQANAQQRPKTWIKQMRLVLPMMGAGLVAFLATAFKLLGFFLAQALEEDQILENEEFDAARYDFYNGGNLYQTIPRQSMDKDD